MKSVVVIGAGGHAKVVVEALRRSQVTLVGVLDRNEKLHGTRFSDLDVLGDDSAIARFDPALVAAALGVGSVGRTVARERSFDHFRSLGYELAAVVHPSAVIATDVVKGAGCQLMAGVVVQPGCVLAENVLLNTRVSVDHDCEIGAHVHIAPGVTLSGGVRVGARTHIGTGATVIQGVTIGEGCIIGAGSVVLRDVPAGATVVGVPARPLV